jgi:hypothetical protein
MRRDTETVSAYHKRLAAAHEAGHLTVACALKVLASAYLIKNRLTKEQKAWGGQCWFSGHIEHKSKRLIALAGGIAEAMVDDPELSEWDIYDLLVLTPDDWLSPTDIQAADLDYLPSGDIHITRALRNAIRKVLKILNENRDFHQWAADVLHRRLEIGEEVSEFMFDEMRLRRRQQPETIPAG